MRYAVIDLTNTVVEVIDLDGSDVAAPSAGQSLVCDPPDGVVAGWVFSQGAFTPPQTLANLQTTKAGAVDTMRDNILTGGFTYNFAGSTGKKVLQTRESDETNWLTLQASCLAAVSAGQGATAGAVIRTLDNVNVSLTYSACLQVMLAMAAWGAAVYAASWSLKDRIAAAVDAPSLAAIDITAGWPANS